MVMSYINAIEAMRDGGVRVADVYRLALRLGASPAIAEEVAEYFAP